MIHAFAKTRSRAQQAYASRGKRPFRQRYSSDDEADQMEHLFMHRVDMSRARPLTDREWSHRLARESRFAAWMGIYGIVIGVLLGWFLASLHVIARHEVKPAPKTMPLSTPAPKARVAPQEQPLEEVQIETSDGPKVDPLAI